MPIYEFACPNCRILFNFLSKRINPDRLPVCPKCYAPILDLNGAVVTDMKFFEQVQRAGNSPSDFSVSPIQRRTAA
jgi:putative FmdB family regulatory protein